MSKVKCSNGAGILGIVWMTTLKFSASFVIHLLSSCILARVED